MKADRIDNPVRVVTKRLYSVDDAAAYLGRSVWAVREMVWAGKIPCIRDGRRMLLDIKDMDSWIEENRMRYSE